MNILAQNQLKRQEANLDSNRPDKCLVCGREAPPDRVFNRHEAIDRKRDGKVTIRYRCVWPDCRRPFSVRECEETAPEKEKMVFAYATLQGTYRQLEKESGYSASTIWRWVHQACQEAAGWLRSLVRVVLEWQPGAPVHMTVREDNRRLWFSRRLRRPGKVDQLLQLAQLPWWVQRCREVAPGLTMAGTLAFCQWLLPLLAG